MIWDWLFFFTKADGGNGCQRIRASTQAEAERHLTTFVRPRVHNVQRVQPLP